MFSLLMLCLIANISSTPTRKLPSRKNTGSFVQESKFDNRSTNSTMVLYDEKHKSDQSVNGAKKLLENPGFAALDTAILRKSFKVNNQTIVRKLRAGCLASNCHPPPVGKR